MDAFGGYLYMVYSSNTRSELYMSRTSDDSNWVNAQRIPNQNTSCLLLAAFGDYLYMVYTSNIKKIVWRCIECPLNFPLDFTIQFQRRISNSPLDS